MFEIPDELALVFSFFIGSCWGSFANVIIYRWPNGKSFVSPRSRCPTCETAISWYDNIPIVSWIFLRGKCRGCQAPISWRYPLVEFLVGSFFSALFFKYGWSWLTLEYWYFIFALTAASFIDLDHFLLPDILTVSGIGVGLVGAAMNPEREFLPAFYGVLLGGGFLWAIAYLYELIRKEEGMGGGDIKLIAWIGAVLGVKAIPFVILAASISGSLIGLFVASRSQKGLKAAIPFGPFLALGAVVYLFWGSQLAETYFNFFFITIN